MECRCLLKTRVTSVAYTSSLRVLPCYVMHTLHGLGILHATTLTYLCVRGCMWVVVVAPLQPAPPLPPPTPPPPPATETTTTTAPSLPPLPLLLFPPLSRS